jgi:phosphoribosyl 1,2-cyclic phosphodiesterase
LDPSGKTGFFAAMSLSITSLNSGSNGNCYYIGNEQEAILVDAGISCRETEKRMKRLDLSLDRVRAIFISHEHSDHIRGLPVLAQKYQLPVYITPHTLHRSRLSLGSHLVLPFQAHAPVQVGALSVTAFPKRHDASDPHSFVVACGEVKVGVFTDIGAPCAHLLQHFRLCHAAFLEANYDEQMLERGRYPYYLKNRIRGGYGHLSNRQALELFTVNKPSFMSHLLLAHLSKDNNCPRLVKELFASHAGGTEIVVASRFEETPVYQVSAGQLPGRPQVASAVQLSLF